MIVVWEPVYTPGLPHVMWTHFVQDRCFGKFLFKWPNWLLHVQGNAVHCYLCNTAAFFDEMMDKGCSCGQPTHFVIETLDAHCHWKRFPFVVMLWAANPRTGTRTMSMGPCNPNQLCMGGQPKRTGTRALTMVAEWPSSFVGHPQKLKEKERNEKKSKTETVSKDQKKHTNKTEEGSCRSWCPRPHKKQNTTKKRKKEKRYTDTKKSTKRKAKDKCNKLVDTQ